MLSCRSSRSTESNHTHIVTFHQQQGKMTFIHTSFLLFLFCVHKDLALDMMPELMKNVLNFGYGVNFKYQGMLSYSFDRFYVVTKFEIPKLEDLRFTTFTFDLTCKNLNTSNHYIQRYINIVKELHLM